MRPCREAARAAPPTQAPRPAWPRTPTRRAYRYPPRRRRTPRARPPSRAPHLDSARNGSPGPPRHFPRPLRGCATGTPAMHDSQSPRPASPSAARWPPPAPPLPPRLAGEACCCCWGYCCCCRCPGATVRQRPAAEPAVCQIDPRACADAPRPRQPSTRLPQKRTGGRTSRHQHGDLSVRKSPHRCRCRCSQPSARPWAENAT